MKQNISHSDLICPSHNCYLAEIFTKIYINNDYIYLINSLAPGRSGSDFKSMIFIDENLFEYVFCKMAAILFPP